MSTTCNTGALEWHLAFNFYPALVPDLIEPCRRAIAAVASGDDQQIITINGHRTLEGQPLTAARLVEDLHLQEFLP